MARLLLTHWCCIVHKPTWRAVLRDHLCSRSLKWLLWISINLSKHWILRPRCQQVKMNANDAAIIPYFIRTKPQKNSFSILPLNEFNLLLNGFQNFYKMCQGGICRGWLALSMKGWQKAGPFQPSWFFYSNPPVSPCEKSKGKLEFPSNNRKQRKQHKRIQHKKLDSKSKARCIIHDHDKKYSTRSCVFHLVFLSHSTASVIQVLSWRHKIEYPLMASWKMFLIREIED